MKTVLATIGIFSVSCLATFAWAACEKHCRDVEWTRTRYVNANEGIDEVRCVQHDVGNRGAKANWFFHNVDHGKVVSNEKLKVVMDVYPGWNCAASCGWPTFPNGAVAVAAPFGWKIHSFNAEFHTACLDP
jgi:hypothetical protein